MSEDRSDSGLNLTGLPALPAGWCWVRLSAIAKIDGGITKDQNRHRTSTMREVPYLRVANVQRGYLDLHEIKTIFADASEVEGLRLQKGDILFTEGGDRDKLGRGWVWNEEIEDCIHQNHIFRARPIQSIAESKFISFHGNFFGQKWFVRTGKQTTNLASINKGVLSRFPVPLAPLNEQGRIVAKIEELFSGLDAGVAALKRAKANLKRYRAAVLKAAVEGKLTEEWRVKHPNTEPASKLLARILTERRKKWEADQLAKFAAAEKGPPKNWKAKYIEPMSADTTGRPQIPDGWCWASVEQVTSLVTKGSSPGWQGFEYCAEGVPFVRSQNVRWGALELDDLVYLPKTFNDLHQNSIVRAGDVLLNLVGASIGRAAVATEAIDGANSNQAVGIIRLIPGSFSSRLFVHVLLSPVLQSYIAKTKADVARANFNLDDIRPTPIPLPPSDEQEIIETEVAERLSQIEAAKDAIDHDLLRAARLRQSILKQAFEGKLVPQDPNDEPASVLLERLRSSRSAHEGNGKPEAPARTRGRKKKARA